MSSTFHTDQTYRPTHQSGDAKTPAVLRVGQDQTLLLITGLLMAFGLIAVFTATAHQAQMDSGNSMALVIKQFIAMGLGVLCMFTVSNISFITWRKLGFLLACVSIGLLLLTTMMGVTANGSERWIPLPFGFQLQPSDIAKITAIFLIAQVTSSTGNASRSGGVRSFMNLQTWLYVGMVGAMILLIYQQPNLSVSMILGITTLVMVFIAGFPPLLLAGITPVAVYFVIQKIMGTPYQKRRIVGWLNPWKDQLDTGYNLIQSYFAISAGGLFGVGLGHSIQKLDYLPFQHTDFIYSIICEELGFIGALIPLGLYGLLAWRGFSIALHCPHGFGRMLAFGVTLSILLQAMINMCVTVGLMPVTGVTLPLISYGGTSVVTTLCMVGILLNISRYRAHPNQA